MKRRRDIIVPASVLPHDRRPIRAETRATLVASIARGRRWLDEIVAGTVTSVEQIAARDRGEPAGWWCQQPDNGRGGPKRHFARHHNCG
jgi:hypothetical protein